MKTIMCFTWFVVSLHLLRGVLLIFNHLVYFLELLSMEEVAEEVIFLLHLLTT